MQEVLTLVKEYKLNKQRLKNLEIYRVYENIYDVGNYDQEKNISEMSSGVRIDKSIEFAKIYSVVNFNQQKNINEINRCKN